MIWYAIIPVTTALAALNAYATRRLWRSAAFERSQQVAQTILIWTVPGFVALTMLATREPPRHRRDGAGGDPTSNNSDDPSSNITTYSGPGTP
jgi:hypothetical protein